MSAREWMVDHVAGVLGIDQRNVVDDALLQDDLGADSLDIIEITMETEAHFSIVLQDDEVAKIRTFGDAVTLVDRKCAEVAA